uniref:Krueppel-like protein 1 n=1 Tax=Ceratitis capitata TaxID=7213 RepID=W8CCM7_CERCA
MVYYQSTQMVIKTEHTSQDQYCIPLQTTSTDSATSEPNIEIQPQTTPHAHSSSSNVLMMDHRQQAQHLSTQLPHTSIAPFNNTHITTSNINLPTNIKAEPNMGIFGTMIPAEKGDTTVVTTMPLNTGTSSAMTISRKAAVNKPQFKCVQCGMTFGSKSAHTSHTKSHAKGNDVVGSMGLGAVKLAEVSEITMPTDIPKLTNTSGVAGGDPYQCNVCKKTFAVPARLIRHYRTHTGERPFECEFCHKLFSVKENLQVHRRIHTKERPYKCDVCERAFEHSGKLHRHMRIHTGERPHKCSVCEKTFIQSGQLVIHMRTHTGEKPYKCPVEGCGKGFTCSKQLKVHSRTHTGEKPYHCDICFRDFGYNHVLKLHRVQHYGSKCYKCTICDKTFKSKKEMEAHIKGHAKELPDEEEDQNVSGTTTTESSGHVNNSMSSSSGGEGSPAPGSPLSPVSANVTITKSRIASDLPNPPSPSSAQSTLSPSSSLASASRLSASSPEPLTTSPQRTQTMEIDHLSHHNGATSCNTNRQLALSLASINLNDNRTNQSFTYIIEDLPTDLSKQPIVQNSQPPTATKVFQHNQQQNALGYQQQTVPSFYSQHHPKHQHMDLDQSVHEPPTINPALLEAASIVRRRDMLDAQCEEAILKNAYIKSSSISEQQIKSQQQHKRNEYQNQQQLNDPAYAIEASTSILSPLSTSSYSMAQPIGHDLSQYDDTREANELIEHYKRGELARHGLHKGYAPVPKYESSLLNNQIVRQVEAAIAPLRSSTESPERSSSPESDSMMMADRDVMTLPLRKRKLYMHEGSPMDSGAMNVSPREFDKTMSHPDIIAAVNNESNHGLRDAVVEGSTDVNNESSSKVMRISSVIQFAKAT